MSYDSEPRSPFRGTTICAVKRDGVTAIAGDGQVTMGEHTIMKGTAKKIRRIYNDRVVIGFAGTVSDAFALAEKLEDDYDKATASQEVKELKNATKLYYELYRKRYEKATILINQKNVDGYIETYHIKKSVT